MIFIDSKLKYMYLWIFISCFSAVRPINAAFLDWIWSQNKASENVVQSDGPLVSVPFEYKTEDEKFLEEASKFTDLMKTSSLDVCQHKVILQIKTSCFSMNEEELAKMSVNLLNCQSEVDGRKVFPCTESMSLKECTKNMDPDMWNAYHLMNNRARAVCLAARRTQFQALSEMTVNKLMSTAHDQIKKMTSLLEGQEKLETLTLGTLDSVEKGHIELMEQQENLKTAQKTVQEFVTFNLEQLTQEKALIAAGNKELAKMTQTIKVKLDEANQQLTIQAQERSENHQKLLEDVEALQKQAQDIFKRIDSSTEKLLAQHEVASLRYRDAVDNLIKINDTVHYLLNIINTTRNEIDERFYWIQDFLDGTGNQIGRLSCITFHIAYLLVGMLFASFLNFSTTSRAVLAVIVPLNLFVTYNHGSNSALDFPQMTVLLSISVMVIAIIHKLQKIMTPKNHARHYLKNTSSMEINEGTDSRSSPTKNSNSVFNTPFEYFSRLFHKFNYSLNQLLSFIFGFAGKKSKTNCYRTPSRREKNYVTSSNIDDRRSPLNNWDDYSPYGERQDEFIHSRVNEWLQTKVDYVPPPGSTSSRTSGTPKFYCTAMCQTGRRCKNVRSPGRDLCHRHLLGTSITD